MPSKVCKGEMNYAVFLPQLKQQLVFHQGANSTSLEFDKKEPGLCPEGFWFDSQACRIKEQQPHYNQSGL